MDLDYALYKQKLESEKNSDLINLSKTIDSLNPKQAQTFLRAIFTDQVQDFYLRKRALQLIGYLTLTNKIKPEWLIAIITDIDETENEFIVSSALKLASYAVHLSKKSIISWTSSLTLNGNSEIRSEAFFLLGKNLLLETVIAENIESFIIRLEESIGYFQKSQGEIENRTDASLLEAIAMLLLNIKTKPDDDHYAIYKQVEIKLWSYIRFNTNRDDSTFFTNIFRTISVAYTVAKSDPENWIDFKTELNEISKEILKLEIRTLAESLLKEEIIDSFVLSLKEGVIIELLSGKLRNQISRLKRIKDESLLDSPAQLALVDDLIDAILGERKKKVFTSGEIIARLHTAFPLVRLERISRDINSIDSSNSMLVAKLFEDYALEYSNVEVSEFKTGYPQGDEMHKLIVDEVRGNLPRYEERKLLEFMLVLRDVISYFIASTRASKKRLPFLFKHDAKEIDLQNSMMDFFNFGKRADQYLPEVSESADGGRTDILYRGQSVQIPLELKRSNEVLTWDSIKADYISQAQTYAYTRDQLAFFIILDQSTKKKGNPSANIKDLFKLIHLDTHHFIAEKFPDFVICLIISGNKIVPNERSK